MRGIYFYSVILAFLLGVLVASFFVITPIIIYWSLMTAFALSVYWRWYSDYEAAPIILSLALVFLVVPLGMLRIQSDIAPYSYSPLLANVGELVTIEGVVAEELDIRERSARMTVKVGDDRVLVSVDRYSPVAYGDRVIVSGKLRLPESFTGDMGRTFHYDGYLRVRDIGYVMSYPESVMVVGQRQGHWFLHALYDFKGSFVNAINRTIPDPSAGLGVGLLLGVKQALGEELERAFRVTGVIHIVVLSGFNVMIVITAVMFLLGSMLSLRPRVVVGLLAITTFALLVGLSATVVRATIMAGLVLIAQLIGRQYHIVRALCLAGAIMVLVEPHILAFDIGFQLSFMATLGLILIAPQFETIMGYVPSKFGIREFLIATIATQIAVLPLLAYHIGEVSLIAVLVNVLILPLVPLAMGLTFIAGMVALFVPVLAPPFALTAHALLLLMIRIVEWSAAVPYAAIAVPVIPWYGVFIMYGVLGVGLYYWMQYAGWRWPWEVPGDKELIVEFGVLSEAVRHKDDIDLSDWTILEEETYRRELQKKPPKPVPHKTDETPVFFR